MYLSIPLKLNEYKEMMNKEILIDQFQDWQKKHYKSICINYSRAPFYKSYISDIEKIYKTKYEYLIDINMAFINFFLNEFHIDTKVIFASKYNFLGQKDERVIDMCQKLGANIFVSGDGSKKYFRPELFNNAEIKLVFQNYKQQIYPQLFGDFLPNLSSLDLLLNCGEKAVDCILNNNLTKKDVLA